ncbi:sensor histidine kinase [Hydromonas duriensis]|uniref:histidine kinase n=1 Tax=Hydromonas duriensis TaxID=1527608 RepID=A0A4R6Y2Y2_9BURK|nr:sensor histidine kinase [Hydromonas duriensis]TDR30904.1 signal transduction histidine kinase [Hydromonas duriensis]
MSQAKVKQKSLFGQIMLWMLIPLMFLWPLSLLISYPIGRSIADTPFDQSLKNNVSNLAQQMRSSYTEHALSTWGLSIPVFDSQDQMYYQIVSSNGETILGTTKMPQPPAADAIVMNQPQVYSATLYNEPVRVAYVWLDLGNQSVIGSHFQSNSVVLIQVAETLNKRKALAREILQGVTLPQLTFLPIAVLLIWFGLSRGIMPLNRLQDSILERDTHDLSDVPSTDAPEELQPLVRSFNGILHRLRRHIALQKRFLTDTAHQIKTPLAGLRMQAELALQTDDPVEQRNSLTHIAAASERTARLVNQLIALSRTEHLAEERLELAHVDIVAIARDQTIFAADRALQKGLHIELDVPDAVILVNAHAIMLGELMKNLIDNAIFYTHTSVTVRITSDATHAHFYVLDDGPGIAPEEREQVFEPFYSVLGEKASTGSGLGLAIVQQIADMHDATIDIAYNSELTEGERHGCVFHVCMPRVASNLCE